MAKKAKAIDQGFEGIVPEALGFFAELDAHQTRDWFLANKARYEATIRAPLGRLVSSLSLAFAVREIPLMGDPKTALFRINRDTRFSGDKRPYKTNASAVLTRDGSKHSPGLVYIHIAQDECFAAAGFYGLEPEQLEMFRRHIVAHPANWRSVEAALAGADLSLSQDSAVSRLPRGFDAERAGDLGGVIRLKAYIVRRRLSREDIASPHLIDQVVDLADAALPLLRFGWAALLPQRKALN